MKYPGLVSLLEADHGFAATLADSRRSGVTTLDVTAVPSFFPLLTASIDQVMERGLHEYLEEFIIANDKLASEITDGYRFYK